MNEAHEPSVPAVGSPPAHSAPEPVISTRRARKRRPGRVSEYAESLLVTVLLALFGTTFVVQAFKIPTSSMEPTLLVGDHLLVNKFVFGGTGAWYETLLPYRQISRGDIVVFKFPYDDHIHYVKRVIGLPGDRVHIEDQQVYVNGEPLDEPYKVHGGPYSSYENNFPPTHPNFSLINVRPEWAYEILRHVENDELVVPEGRYFVLGDNRDFSLDSRFWGFVDRDSIMGRPLIVYWSVEASSGDYADRTLAGRLVGLWHALLELPSRTRWDRVLTRVD